jgi:hypothetical protein
MLGHLAWLERIRQVLARRGMSRKLCKPLVEGAAGLVFGLSWKKIESWAAGGMAWG